MSHGTWGLSASHSQAWPIPSLAVRCLHGQSAQSVHRGTTAQGTQRSRCHHTLRAVRRLLLHDRNRGGVPEIKPPLIAMRLKASGVRDTVRSLPLCPNTVPRAFMQNEGRWSPSTRPWDTR
jgi:hypothetical protein